MANVLFKKGLQANLTTVNSNKSAVEGAFYLTTDSHRLYIGLGDGTTVPINEGVTKVADLATILAITPEDAWLTAGQFYYAEAENILCVYNGKRWVQINPDNNTIVEGLGYNVTVSEGVATVKSTITNSDSSTAEGSFTITGSNGITVAGSGKAITISGPEEYTIAESVAAGTASIELSQGETSKGIVKIAQGDNVIIGENASGDISIAAKDTTLTENSLSIANNATEGFDITITDSSSNTSTATINPKISVNGTSVSFKEGVATLDTYTKAQIDTKMKQFNAMLYLGTIGTGGSLDTTTAPSSDVQIGDTYLVVGDDAVIAGSSTATKGDMIIARGTEGTDGFITSETLVWDVVPSGDDASLDTTYKGVAIDNGMTIVGSTNSTPIASISVVGDETYLTTEDAQADAGKTNVITIKHKEVVPGDTEETSTITPSADTSVDYSSNTYKFDAVTKVTKDEAGHVSGVETTEVSFKVSIEKVKEAILSAAAADNTATLTSGVKVIGVNNTATSLTKDLTISSESLTVTSPSNSSINLEMVWGSF